MRSTFNILFYINKQKIKKNGKCPILGRITLDGKVTQFSTKEEIIPALWSATDGCSTAKDRAGKELNHKLEQFRKEGSYHYQKQIEHSGYVTAESLKNAIQGIGIHQAMLLGEHELLNEEVRQSIGITREMATYSNYLNSYKNLKRFINYKYETEDIAFDELNYSFIEDYDFYLRINACLSPQTVAIRIRDLRRIIKRAINKEIIRRDPFAGFKTKKVETIRKWLSKEDLDKIMQTPVEHKGINLVRNLFVFSCFSGLSFCDMRNLTRKHIVTDNNGVVWIRQKRKKTGTQANVPLMDIPLSILNKYGKQNEEGNVFSIGSYSVVLSYLKELRRICGLQTCLSYHQSRHTWATTICLSNGMPIETLSRTMGHKDISTTQIYAKITTQKIDRDMQALEKRLGNKYRFEKTHLSNNQLNEKAI